MTLRSSDTALAMAADAAHVRAMYAQRQADDPRYSCFSPGHLYMIHERERRVLALLRRCGAAALSGKRILEIGCGSGSGIRDVIRWGARPEDVTGVDLLQDRIEAARRLCPSDVRLHCANAAQLPFRRGSFDLVFQSTVFSSLLDPRLRRQVAAEMTRVLEPGGLIVWYDFHVDNPWNPDVRGVRRRELRELFPGCTLEVHRLTLAPPLLRRLARHSWIACDVLSAFPWLCTHHLAGIRRPKP